MADPVLKPDMFIPGPVAVRTPLDVVNRALPALSDGRNLTPLRAFAQFFNTVEIRTRVSPPIILDISRLDDPTPNPLLDQIKPAIILRGPAGTKVIAPYGEVPSGNEGLDNAWKIGGLIVGGIAVVGIVGFLGGTLRQKVKARRRARQDRVS